MTEKCERFCSHHSEIAYRVERLSVRMDRIEMGIVGVLFLLVAQLWMLYDLPGKIQDDRRSDKVISDAHADEGG